MKNLQKYWENFQKLLIAACMYVMYICICLFMCACCAYMYRPFPEILFNACSFGFSKSIFTALVMKPQPLETDVLHLQMQAALSTLLLIIYNCSGQVLTTRERRQAKTREAAARSARETTRAREKWKAAKDAAKRRAVGLQAHLSRTFSRKKYVTNSEELRILGQDKPVTDDDILSPMHISASGASQLSSVAAKGKEKEPSELAKMMHVLDDDLDSFERFNLENGDKNSKKHMPKGKEIHTHSQIFKYAYAQLEKEKALQQENKDLTFSGVISMATDTRIKKRPLIEVAFRDLTLTLKGKNKHLLRCVTGKIMPGRITAVMGPSGAGKTTFISALAGKAIGCRMAGLILINGVNESIHSYKKIMGFVPQDDIVHGNLTVEENLWFSARCRYAKFHIQMQFNLLSSTS